MKKFIRSISEQPQGSRLLANKLKAMLKKICLTLCLCLMFFALCATKCPDIGAEWNPTGNPIGGGPGYKNIVDNWDFYVTSKSELINAVAAASSGNTIYVDDNAEIDLTGDELVIPGGVTLASGRGRIIADSISWGALLYTDDVFDDFLTLLITSAGEGIRVTGLRIRGPYHYRSGREDIIFSILNNSYGIFAWHDELEVDNCEFWGWSHSAIYFSNTSGYAHHNYIHEGQNCGQGLGVMVGHHGEALIEANIFDFIRENIASVGDTNTSWEARYNIGLEHTAEHNFDRHGWPSQGAFGGRRTIIHHNTSRNLGNRTQTKGKSIRIRGMPVECCSIYNNWLYPSDSAAAILLWRGDTNCVISNNHFNMDPPSGLSSRLPIAIANADVDSGATPLTVSFFGVGSFDPDGHIAWCEWDFGDNSNTVRKSKTVYTFHDVGVYNVRLTVHDDDGIPDSDLMSIIAVPPDDSLYISLWVNDRYHSNDTGFFFKQLLLDDTLIWEDDVASCEGWIHVTKNVTDILSEVDSVTITCRLLCKKQFDSGSIVELQTYWDDAALFWGNVQNGSFEMVSGQTAAYWQYAETNKWFHGSCTSGDVRSGNSAFRIFFYTQNGCSAGQYGEISQKVAIGSIHIPKSERQGNLFCIYPNPTLKTTAIAYRTAVRSAISIKVYDANGRLVKSLMDDKQEVGFYQVNWDGSDDIGRKAANGVYFCKFVASPVGEGEEYIDTKKIVLLR